MIEEKLKQARLRTAKGRMQLGIGLFATICLCALLVAGLSFFDFSPKNLPVAELPKEKRVENDTEKIREDLTLEMVKQADQIFEENMEKAGSLLAEERYEGAKRHIEKALSVHPQSSGALALAREIETLPQILVLLNGARIARVENDLEKEYDFLRQVLGVAPEREEVKERLGLLAGLIRSRNFDRHISSGFANIDDGQANEARTHYQEAKKIDPQRPELSTLNAQLLDLEKSLRVEQAVSQAEQAIRQDDWQKARVYFARAAKDAPENKKVAEGLQRADHDIELLASLGLYLKTPYRLSNPDVRKRANETLVQAETASGYSFAIRTQARQLSELMTRVNTPILVTVISDNQTYVLVRSVGKVGVVFQKNIQLKPGNYTFEGTRKGFKSKLVQAFIPYDQDSFRVRVICDELI